jgi:CheY-like chemotaxis protein
MPRVVVVHFEPAEASRLAARLAGEGFDSEAYLERGYRGFRRLRENPPDVILIDLIRLPFYGRYVGVELRKHKGTRAIPLAFLKGAPEKTAQVKALFPDAVFATLPKLAESLRRAIRKRPAEPVVPKLEHAAAAPKLRIRESSVVAMLHTPEGLQLGPMPEGVTFQKRIGEADVVISFVKSMAALGRELPVLAKAIQPGRTVWVSWPKRASKTPTDLTQPRIAEICGPFGLTAYKSCAIDETWSALAIAKRRR